MVRWLIMDFTPLCVVNGDGCSLGDNKSLIGNHEWAIYFSVKVDNHE